MALDAGSVFATLGGKLDESAFVRFGQAMDKSTAAAEAFEAKVTVAMERTEAASKASSNAMVQSAQRSARASTESAARIEAANKAMADSVAASAAKIQWAGDKAAMSMTKSSRSAAMWSDVNKRAGKSVETFGHAAKLAVTGGLLVVAAATYEAAKAAMHFNAEMVKVHTQAGASMTEVKKLSGAVLELAGSVPQSPKELAQALYHLESAGFRGAQAMSLLEAAAKGAALGGARLEDTTQAMIATTASHIKGVKGAADAMGQLNTIVGVGDMRMEQLAQAMATGILPSAHDAGLSLTDVGAAMATVTDNATPANVTATRLRMTLALMNAPSKAAAKELASIGMTSTQMAHDMRQPNGLLKAVEDLKTHLEKSGKSAEEQDATLTRIFGGGRSSAVIHTLLSQLDRLRDKYKQLGGMDGAGRLAEAWAKFQHTSAAQFAELKSSAESFAITVGNMLLPQLAHLADNAAHALAAFVKGGGAAQVGHALTDVFSTLGHIVGDIAPHIADIARALVDVGRALDLGSVHNLEAMLAAFAGFKAASFVAPILIAVAGAMNEVVMAARTAPTIAAFGADIVAMTGPIGAIAAVVGAAAGAFMLLRGNERSEAEAARDVAAAKRDELTAIQAVRDAVLGAADATFAARRADQDLHDAKQRLADAAKRFGKESPQYRQALDDERQAALRDTAEHEQLRKAKEQMAAANKKAQAAAQDAVDAATRLRDRQLKDATRDFMNPAGTHDQAKYQQEIVAAWQAYDRTIQDAARGTAAATISAMQLSRVLNGQKLITDAGAASVANLARVYDSLPKKTQLELATTDESALVQIGQLVGQLRSLPKQQIVQILAKADTAREQIAALTAAVHHVPTQWIISVLSSADSERLKILELTAAAHGVPRSIITQITSSAAAERVKVAALTAAIEGVPTSKISHILADGALSAAGQVQALSAAINSLHDRSVTVTVTNVTNQVVNDIHRSMQQAFGGRASGRRAGQAEMAMVGESPTGPREYIVDRRSGRGFVTDGPMMTALGPDDFVVPTETRFRGPALELFHALARDLGVPGYAKGKAPKKPVYKPHPIPAKIAQGGVPFDDVRRRFTDSESGYKRALNAERTARKNLEKARGAKVAAEHQGHRLKGGQWSNQATRDNAARRVQDMRRAADRAHSVTAQRKPAMEARRREYLAAKRTDDQIKNLQTDVNVARQAMQDADSHHDARAFDAAKARRTGQLKRLVALLQRAFKLADGNTDYGRQLKETLSSLGGDAAVAGKPPNDSNAAAFGGELGDTLAAEPQDAGETEADRMQQTGMTDAERAELTRINRDTALAALTPDLGDDTAAARRLVDFLGGVLGEVQATPGTRGGDVEITDIAQQLKTAQDNLRSLTTGGASNDNADLQAQIDQANQRAAIATESARVANNALAVFGGSGDIGAGAGTALGAAAAPSIVIQTLHPADPATLTAIGAAATAGIGLQGAQRATTIRPGI